MPITIPQNYTASEVEPEQRVAYFREDIGINLHHWHWHLVYPFDARDRSIVNKDRRGELFYYMHQQIVARFVMVIRVFLPNRYPYNLFKITVWIINEIK